MHYRNGILQPIGIHLFIALSGFPPGKLTDNSNHGEHRDVCHFTT